MNSADIFTEWATYAKLVAHDYMHHGDFFDALGDYLRPELDEPLSVVDLGCGDAQPVLALLGRFEVRKYVGIDESSVAIDRAREALSRLGVSFELRQGTMPQALEGLAGSFDLTLASYSLHHLDPAQKRLALAECRRLLRPGGVLAVVDVFLDEGESREDYLARWEHNARRSFSALTADEMQALIEHVHLSDYPETVAEYGRLARTCGFTATASIRQDAEQLNRLVVIC